MFEGVSFRKTVTASTGKTLFFAIVFIVSSVATFGFFSTFLANFMPAQLGEFRAMASGFVGWLLLDAASFIWQYVRVNACDSQDQMDIAAEMSTFTIGAAIVITVSHMILTGYELVTDPLIRQWAGYIGLAVAILVFGYQFYRVWSFMEADPTVHRKEQFAQLRAQDVDLTTNMLVDRLRNTRADRVAAVAEEMEGDIEEQITSAMRGKTKIKQPNTYHEHRSTTDAPPPNGSFSIVSIDGGQLQMLPVTGSLRNVWAAVDARAERNPDANYFVINKLTNQPVDRNGKPIDVQVTIYDETDVDNTGNGLSPLA